MVIKSDPDTVLLEGRDAYREDGEASAAITPGHLIELSGLNTGGAGDLEQFAPHSTDDGGDAEAAFALEYGKTGKGISDDYASGEHLEYRVGAKGDEFYSLLAAGTDLATAANATVSPGDVLVSAGDGSLRTGGTAGNGVAIALESVDNSGAAAGEHARVKVRVI